MLLKAFSVLALIIGVSLFTYAEAGIARTCELPNTCNQVGFNYDNIRLFANVFEFRSHYPRVLDNGEYVNYIWFETADIIKFDSARASILFDKRDCSFTLYEPQTANIALDKYQASYTVNTAPVILSSCSVSNISTNTDGLSFETIQTGASSEFKTLYEMHASNGMEWTYKITNNDLISLNTYEIIEECRNCSVNTEDNDFVNIGLYTLDTKNRVHGTVKTVDKRTGLSIIYETEPLMFLGSRTIDPSATLSPQDRGYDNTASATGGICPTTVGGTQTLGADPIVRRPASATNERCYVGAMEFDISALPNDSIVTSIILESDITSPTYPNPLGCDFVQLTTYDLSTAAHPNMWTETTTGTAYLSNDTQCGTDGTNRQTADLGATAHTDLETHLATDDLFTYGIRVNDYDTRGGADSNAVFSNNEIIVTYVQPTYPFMELSETISNIGDAFRITGTISVLEDNVDYINITQIVLRANGTIVNTNGTNHNQTAPYTISFGPLWYQATDDLVKNLTVTARAINDQGTSLNETKSYNTREYGPDYIQAVVASQGDVNYTKPTSGGVKVNRDKGGATFQIECTCFSYADAFLNQSAGSSWSNTTNTGYFQFSCPSGTFVTSCYNEDLLFTTSYPANSSAILVSGVAIFDQLGGFMGAPAAILMVLAIYSLGTGRNFPIISVVAMSAMGVMGALGLLVFSGEVWALLMVITGVSLFGVRKFF